MADETPPPPDELRAVAHVDGYLVGARGLPCLVPAYDSLVLGAAWMRGWRIGRRRMGFAAPPPDAVVVVAPPVTDHEEP